MLRLPCVWWGHPIRRSAAACRRCSSWSAWPTGKSAFRRSFPAVIIADEPTGNLDPVRSLELMLLLEKINELGTTVLVVTHEKELVDAFSKRVISIDAGRVISDGLDGYYGYEAE